MCSIFNARFALSDSIITESAERPARPVRATNGVEAAQAVAAARSLLPGHCCPVTAAQSLLHRAGVTIDKHSERCLQSRTNTFNTEF